VLQGGIGPAGLASEDLHVLDFTDFERPRWHRCNFYGLLTVRAVTETIKKIIIQSFTISNSTGRVSFLVSRCHASPLVSGMVRDYDLQKHIERPSQSIVQARPAGHRCTT
jgi:hypothetical protein